MDIGPLCDDAEVPAPYLGQARDAGTSATRWLALGAWLRSGAAVQGGPLYFHHRMISIASRVAETTSWASRTPWLESRRFAIVHHLPSSARPTELQPTGKDGIGGAGLPYRLASRHMQIRHMPPLLRLAEPLHSWP
jgi:hypothetical protein